MNSSFKNENTKILQISSRTSSNFIGSSAFYETSKIEVNNSRTKRMSWSTLTDSSQKNNIATPLQTDLARLCHSYSVHSCFCDRQHFEKNGVRLLAGGSAAVFDHELLELVFCDMMSTAQAKKFVQYLFEEFGNLNAVFEASKQRILKVPGSTLDAYLRIRVVHTISLRMARSKIINRSVLSCWDDLILYCRTSMAHKEKEQFRVFFLDKKNSVVSDEEQAEGTIDHVPVYPRELAKRALELNAKAIILVHNHPSGDPSPSPEDIKMTRSIQKACEAIGVTVHDHVVIGRGKEFSFKAAKYL